MKVQQPITNFTGGELSPRLDIRIDTKKYANGAFTIENGIVMPHGGIRKRGGTTFIAEVALSGMDTRLIPFEFNTEQAYMLEVGNTYIRPFKDQGTIIASSKAITGITKANPGVVTATAHGFSTGDQIYLSGIGGMTQLNNRRVTITVVDANSFSVGINTTSYTTYTSGGVAEKPVQITTGYGSAVIDALTHAQSADTLFIAHEDFVTRKLTRSSHTAWAMSDTDIKNGPFRAINVDDRLRIIPTLTAASVNISAATKANPCVVTTSSAHGLSDGAFVAISGVGGMTQINSAELSIRNPTSTTFELYDDCGRPINSTGYGTYTSGGSVVQTVSIWGTFSRGAKVTLTATSALFSASMVGALWRLWEPGKVTAVPAPPLGSTFDNIGTGQMYTRNGHVYGIQNLVGSSSGWARIADFPSHGSGSVHFTFNRQYGMEADVVFLHDSFSVLEITAYSSATSVTAIVRAGHIPDSVVTYGTAYWEEGAWSDERGYPALVGFHEGRLYAAASTASPQTVWASRTQAFEDFQDGADDDRAITYTAASGRIDKFLWMMPGKTMALGTASSEFIAAASNQNEALTPSNVRMVPQTQYGSSERVTPIRIGNVILFGQRRGSVTNPARKIRELSYNFEADSYLAADATIVSEHITKTGVTEMAFQADPDSIGFCVRADGQMAGITYEADQDVRAWHRHVVGGSYAGGPAVIERVATLPGTSSDEVWMIVKRTIGGATKRYIEVMTTGLLDGMDEDDAVYLDSALTYDGAETSTITGLWHLEGQEVYALADGAKQGPFTVASGAITLTTAASLVHVGLNYQTTIETTDLEAGARAGTAKSREKNLSEVFLDVYRSLGGRVGMGGTQYSAERMLDILYRTPEDPMGSAPGVRTGLQRFGIPGGWDSEAIIRIEHDEPYPFMLLGIVAEISTSG